jgi:hypothetical protein
LVEVPVTYDFTHYTWGPVTTLYRILGRPLDTSFRALIIFGGHGPWLLKKEPTCQLQYGRRLFGRNTRCGSWSTKAKAGSGFALDASSCVLAAFGRRWGGLPRVGPVPTKLLAGADTPTGRILFLLVRLWWVGQSSEWGFGRKICLPLASAGSGWDASLQAVAACGSSYLWRSSHCRRDMTKCVFWRFQRLHSASTLLSAMLLDNTVVGAWMQQRLRGFQSCNATQVCKVLLCRYIILWTCLHR